VAKPMRTCPECGYTVKKTAKAQGAASRRKGAALERRFRSWLEGETGWEFKRTQAMGERQRGRIGDVMCMAGEWPFFAECKNREEDPPWSLTQAWQGVGPVERWWDEAEEKADGLLPLLLFTRNRVPVYAMVEGEGLRWWSDRFGAPSSYLRMPDGRTIFVLEDL